MTLAAALEARLDAELALRAGLARHLDAAEATRPLRRLEHVDVDLRPEDLAKAAHVVTAVERVAVAVQVAAAKLEAAAGLDQLVAESPALTALADACL